MTTCEGCERDRQRMRDLVKTMQPPLNVYGAAEENWVAARHRDGVHRAR